MDISIITMTTTYNYGATLQAFALQCFLESLGHSVQLIDHMSSSEEHKTIHFNEISRANLYKLLYKEKLEEGYSRFEKYYKDFMHMSKRIPDYKSLQDNPPLSSVFISGSDQVWNPRDPKLKRFLLEFVPGDRVKASYAASVADSTIPEEYYKIYEEYLERFDHISVREEQGKQLISKLTNKDISINCDPIFLIDNWEKYESKVELPYKSYILCYMLYTPPWFDTWIKKLKKVTSLPIVFVGLNGYRKIYSDFYVRNAGPMEFLWLIHHSELIVSSSFHGNAFSIKYGKPFFSLPDLQRPDRIVNLLRPFSLEHNIIYEPNYDYNGKEFDNKHIKNIIETEKCRSTIYLRNVLGTVKKQVKYTGINRTIHIPMV